MNKKELRKTLLQDRARLQAQMTEQARDDIAARLIALLQNLNCDKLALFKPFGSEINILPPLLAKISPSIQLFYPRTTSESELVFVRDQGQGWQVNRYGIHELESFPQETILEADTSTLVLTPCLAVEKHGYRLGYGGGFYDRYIRKYPQAHFVALAFEEHVLESLPYESFDEKVQFIITDKRTSACL